MTNAPEAPAIHTGKGLTRRERLRRCYFHEKLDRPGVYTRTGYPPNDPTYDELRAYMEAHTECKAKWGAWQLVEPLPVEATTEPHSEDFERRIRVLHTPKGDLRASHLVSLRGQPGLHEEFFLKDRDDAEKYLSLPLPQIRDDVASFFEADRAIGDAGIVSVTPGRSPGGHVAELFGSERFALMSATDRDVLHALCERERQVTLSVTEVLLTRGVGPFFGMAGEEYIVPPLHGPQDFADFIVKYEKPIFDRIHEAGGRVHVHCHGSIRALIVQFVEMGVDVLHPFEAPPSGDIQPGEAKEAARGRMTLEGNLQIADLYEQSPEEIAAQTEALIGETFDDRRGLIVCPTASPYIRGQGRACLPQYRAMVEAVLGWKG